MAFPKEIILYINIVLVLTGAIFAFLATEVYAFVPTASPSQTFATRTKSYLNTTPVESFPRTRSVIRRRTRATPTIEAVAPEAVFASVNPVIERTGHASGVDVDGTQLPPWTPPLLLSEGLLDDPTKVALFALGGLAVAAAGFQTAVYWRMQYVVAALLSNRVPTIKGGAEVLELSAKDTKTLYYMPTGGVRRLTLSTVKDLEQEVVNGAAIQAKIPTALVRKQEAGRVSCTTASMDCVVSVFGFSGGVTAGSTTSKDLAVEVARVLKPGGTLLFVEKGEAKGLAEEVKEALGTVEINIVRNLVDPYCVGLGTKTKATEEEAGGLEGASSEGQEGNRRTRRLKKKSGASESK